MITEIWHNNKLLMNNSYTKRMVDRFACLPENSCLFNINCSQCSEDEFLVADNFFVSGSDESKDFIGFYVNSVDGLTNSAFERSVTKGLNGPYSEKATLKERELVVRGYMFALNNRGMDYAIRMLQHDLWDNDDFCGSNTFKFRYDCDRYVMFKDVIVTSGPKVESFFPNNQCFSQVRRFEIILTALDPYFYEDDSEIVFEGGFDLSDPGCHTWDDEAVDHVCGPECCQGCVDRILPGLFDSGEDCCYCRPWVPVVKQFNLRALPYGVEYGFDVEVCSGGNVFENASLAVLSEPVSRNNFDPVQVLSLMEFAAVPANTSVYVNGRDRMVSASCDRNCFDSDGWVFASGGLPFKFNTFKAPKGLTVLLEGDWGSLADDAAVKVTVWTRHL